MFSKVLLLVVYGRAYVESLSCGVSVLSYFGFFCRLLYMFSFFCFSLFV